MTTSARPMWADLASHQIALQALQQFQWSVFPLDEEKKPPLTGETSSDGQPKRLGWKRLQARCASAQEILHWQKTYAPSAWAVITGAMSRIVILDFDGEAGQQTRTRLGLDRPHVQTGSGGHHVYFRHPGWHVSTLNGKTSLELGRQWPGLDIRADGGYAAFCGRNTGGPYLWLREPVPEPLSLLPDDVRRFLGLLEPPEEKKRPSSPSDVPPDSAAPAVPASVLLNRALRQIKERPMGRNDAGFWLACQLRDHGYPQQAASEVLRDYAERVPKENSKGRLEPYTREEAMASVMSAFGEVARRPWERPSSHSSGNGGEGPGAPPRTGTPEGPDPLPEIFINGEQLREMVDQSVAAIMRQEQQTPSLFMQSARLVRVGRNELGRPLLTQMGVAEVKEVLTHAANFFRLKKVSGQGDEYEKSPVSPPKELAEQILARQTQEPYLPFPALSAIVETPVLRPDGSILDQPGYDRATQLYYAPGEGMDACKVPLKPTPQQREDALALLLSAVGEFPYVSDADRANALGLLLTPLLRPAVKRHVALALIDAPKQGTGKGLLSDVVSLIATGNNIKLGGDLARRCYRIRLDARTSRPFLRKDFTHSDLITWVSEHRAELVGALLTLARAWYAGGKPKYDHLPSLGTFSGWVKIIGGILEYAGVRGFLSNLEQLYEEADEDGAQWEAFLYTWHHLMGEEWVPLAAIIHAIDGGIDAGSGAGSGEENGEHGLNESLPEALQIALKEKPKSFGIRLGKALDRRVDTCFGVENFRLEKKRDIHSKTSLWRVFAGCAGSDSLPTRSENSQQYYSNIAEKNKNEIDRNHSPHTPQVQTAQSASNGLGGGIVPIPGRSEEATKGEKATQHPATAKEREVEEL